MKYHEQYLLDAQYERKYLSIFIDSIYNKKFLVPKIWKENYILLYLLKIAGVKLL